MILLRLFVVVQCGLLFGLVSGDCPCSSSNLCKPVSTHYSKELVVFGVNSHIDKTWKKWNWTEITHVILIGSLDLANELYCFAHSKHVRVTMLVGMSVSNFPKLSDRSFRNHTTYQWIDQMKKYNLDGLNIDIEGAAYTKDVVDGISALTKETYIAVKNLNSNFIVTFDVPYSPYLVGCISGYCYDYVALSKATDYLISMDYDATIDILIANANSPIYLIKEGYDLYLKNLSISPQQFVMAVPWYGYDYTCSHFYNATGHDLCVILGSGGTQDAYFQILQQFKNNIGGLKWNERAQSPYFTTKQNGIYHQFHFDNIDSLIVKFQLAMSLNLRGLSMFNSGCLDYASTDPEVVAQTTAMWNTFTEYFRLLKAK